MIDGVKVLERYLKTKGLICEYQNWGCYKCLNLPHLNPRMVIEVIMNGMADAMYNGDCKYGFSIKIPSIRVKGLFSVNDDGCSIVIYEG